MEPDEIIAAVEAKCGPSTEWNLCEPGELVAAWRLALCGSRPVPVEVTVEDMEWARRVFAEDAVKREFVAERDALRERVAELERDAARYRWLLEDASEDDLARVIEQPTCFWDYEIDAEIERYARARSAMQESAR